MDYFSSRHFHAIKQIKKQLNLVEIFDEVNVNEKINIKQKLGDFVRTFDENKLKSFNDSKATEIISRYKSVETLKSWQPELFCWLQRNNKLYMIKHLRDNSCWA